jgi:UDP-N-acetylglucosamine--N-acetylmuramyl-(pentapeptide) pyrophosphoryl-undecaprenol N-acetylglucosamine transferase
MAKQRKIIISGGGTGGHIFPAIAIANALKQMDDSIEILFVGAKGKMEMERVPQAGYPIKGLWISGFQRQLTFKNLMFPFKLLSSLVKAYSIVRTFKPDVAIGVGGFASGPTLEMASKLGVPTLIQEQNSYAGVTNRLLAKKVNKVCVAYEGMERFFPKENIVFTGNPIRQEITQIEGKREEAMKHFGLDPMKKTIVVVGGSLGARAINDAIEDSFDGFANHQEIQVLWQAGKLYIEEFEAKKTCQLPNVHLTKFIDRMDLAYAAADLLISRAGAATISELCLVQKPAILMPSPNVAEDHQTKNALALVEKDAAVMVKDKEGAEKMFQTAIDLLNDDAKLQSLSNNIGKLGMKNAAETIAKEVLKLINR